MATKGTRGKLKRTRQTMPASVRKALTSGGALAAYRARPEYQQNDYLGWIARAARDETKQKRVAQMVAELEQGNVYMKMKWSPQKVAAPTRKPANKRMPTKKQATKRATPSKAVATKRTAAKKARKAPAKKAAR